MAFNQNYRPTSENSVFGMCSSHSYLDGVPFKISTAFKPQAQPSLSPELLHASEPCGALHEQYAFDTEEAVLAWSKAREEAKAKAIADRQAAERTRAALAAAESSSSESEDDAAASDEQSAVKTSESEVPMVKPPWQLPVGASLSNTILMPTPIQTSQKKVQSPMAPKAAVDLALFEKEDDPFDNMELQTLNDMEELRTLLGGTVDGPSPSHDCQTTLETTDKSKGANAAQETPSQESENVKPTRLPTNNIFSSIPGVKMFEHRPSDSTMRATAMANNVSSRTDHLFDSSAGTPSENTGDDNYVKIRPDYSQQSVPVQRDSTLANSEPRSDRVLGGELPLQYTNSKAFKPVLPPIRPRGKSLGGEGAIDSTSGNLINSSVSSAAPSSVPQPLSGSGFMRTGMSQSAYVVSTSTVSNAVDMSVSDISLTDQRSAYTNFPGSQSTPANVAASAAFTNNLYSRYNLGSESPIPTSGEPVDRGKLRSAKSNPDLLARSPSPYNGRSHSSSQPWNPYQPLPPTPVPGLRSASSSPEPTTVDLHQSPSPQPATSSTVLTSQPEYDPYPSLSSEAKTFVNNLTSMGFSRSRVSRAVEKFGVDEREVVDHLLNVDKLVEKSFSPALAETSLQLFRNNICKAEQFLGLYQQFTELGFTGERIQTALVKHELDRDKALDYLTT